MSAARVREVTLAGTRTRLLEAEGEGPGFVLLHGWSDSAEGWRPVVERLARAGVRVTCPDMPGHGGSELRRDRPILEQWEAVARAAIEAHGGERVVAGGYSLGGLTALRIARRPPAGLAGAAPIAPPGLERARWEELLERTAPLTRVALALPAPVPTRLVHALTAAIYRRVGLADPARLTADVLKRYTDFWGDRRRVGRQVLAMVELVGELREPLDLEPIEVPILLLWGREDRVLPWRAARALAATKPDARVELIDGCGHVAPLEAPDPLARHLLTFRETLRGAPVGA